MDGEATPSPPATPPSITSVGREEVGRSAGVVVVVVLSVETGPVPFKNGVRR